jgi:REP element-mobilizing transposase RayT
VLRRPELAKIAADSILLYNEKKYQLDRFVIMPNHVHAIVQFHAGESLKIVGQSWMRYSARRINTVLKSSGSFWQAEPFDHLVRSPEQFDYIQKYVADNPAKAKLKDGEFLYWQRS